MANADPLAHLQPKVRDAAVKKARLIELADSILAARMRRVSLAAIAEGIRDLKERPITVSPDYLSAVMAECHGKAWFRAEAPARRTAKAKGKAKAKVANRMPAAIAGEPKGGDPGQGTIPAPVQKPERKAAHAAQRNAGRKT